MLMYEADDGIVHAIYSALALVVLLPGKIKRLSSLLFGML